MEIVGEVEGLEVVVEIGLGVEGAVVVVEEGVK